MAELASKIREILDSLAHQDDTQAKDVFRRIFCNLLGFSYASEEVDPEYFRPSVSEVVKSVEVIAKTEPTDGAPFFIIYVSAGKMTKTLRQMLIRDLLNFTEAIDLTFANFITIIGVGDVWQIVAPLYRKETDKVVLRTYTVGLGEKHRTVAEALSKLKVEKPHPSALQIKDIVDEAMYIRPLTEEFFEDYKKYYSLIYNHVLEEYSNVFAKKYSGNLPTKIFTLRAAKSFAHSLLNRLMFIYFLQKKGWIGDRKDFVRWLWDVYKEDERQEKEFYRDYLRPLLLEAMNKPKNERNFSNLPDEVVRVFLSVPYFNGGLFSHVFEENVDIDEIVASIPDEVLKAVIFEFLEEYNFTVTEESPYEVEIAVDPAMLGHIYESLIAEQERGVSGIFYTPRVEVDLMCRLAIFEYLLNFTDDRMKLLEFVFKPPSEFEDSVSREILNALENAKIVDPACGSGAFLIGAYYVIRELLEKAGIYVDFERKREIFRRNLYGVDIKEWAVRVAELRMWLALIEEEEELPGAEPVLPNLNVNLKVGDSLIPEVEINGKKVVLPKSFLEKWKEYIKRYISGNNYKEIVDGIYDGIIDKSELERIKIEILKSVVKELRKKAFITQKTLTGEEVKIGEFSEDERRLIKLLDEAEDIKVPFIWELDFPEVFASGGFDIVISNPPYISKNKIYPEYLDKNEFEMLDDKDKEILKKKYKQLVENITEDVIKDILNLKQNFKLNKRSDLYVYFFVHSVYLLKRKGTLVYITSNSWLDVDYGTKLQEFFLRATELEYIIDNIKRTFEQAEINTVITVLKRKEDEDVNIAKGNCTNFVLLKVPFENITFNDIVEITTHYCDTLAKKVTVFGGDVYLHENERVRVRSVRDVDLCVIGGVSKEDTAGVEEGKIKSGIKIKGYGGAKWGSLLIRAPTVYYKLIESGKTHFKKLGDLEKEGLIDINEGKPTGANSFAYVPIETVKQFNIEKGFLKPALVKTRGQCKTVITEKDIDRFLLDVHLPKEKLKGTNVLNYIEYCEKLGVNKRKTLRSKNIWYSFKTKNPADLILPCGINDLFFCSLNLANAITSNSFAEIRIKNDNKELLKSLWGFFNSTIGWLTAEIFGRSSLGGGMLKLDPIEYRKMYVICDIDTNKIGKVMNKLSKRKLLTIFEELGLPKPNEDLSNINPEEVRLENIMPDRRELDRIFFEALGLTEEEQLEVYKAVVELVKQRLAKARTFKSKKS